MYRKNIVYIEFSPICSFRHLLRVLKCIPYRIEETTVIGIEESEDFNLCVSNYQINVISITYAILTSNIFDVSVNIPVSLIFHRDLIDI